MDPNYSTAEYKDAFGRVKRIETRYENYEHYLRPEDGRLTVMSVLGAGNMIEQPRQRTNWTFLENIKQNAQANTPFGIQLVCWMYSFVFKEGTGESIVDQHIVILAIIWVPCCLLLLISLVMPANLEGQMRNGGFYDPILYRDWGRPKISRNPYEAQAQSDSGVIDTSAYEDTEAAAISRPIPIFQARSNVADDDSDIILPRHFGPRYLCFLKNNKQGNSVEFETRKVADWIGEHGEHADTDFIFVSYTRHQFCVDTAAEIYNSGRWSQRFSDTEKSLLVQIANKDRRTLLEYGAEAARSAGKGAFWVDFECIRDVDSEATAVSHSDDVNRICDIVRAAHSMIILLGPSVERKILEGVPQTYNPHTTMEWLQEYGDRLWTLPEILLCSPEHRIKLYFIGKPGPPEQIAKRNFPARAVWRDADLVRQLVDHFESTIHLSALELVSIALKCLAGRETQKFSEGDIAYALMGLLRRRPKVVRTDSSFEAFARLSLANVNDSLLERLLCMQPTNQDAPWSSIEDAWNVQLWDIEPRCQVAGIVDDQTVTLDGAFGATILWDRMEQVAFFKRQTPGRTIAKFLLRALPLYLIIGIALVIASAQAIQDFGSVSFYLILFMVLSALLFAVAVIVLFLAPWMVFNLYRGKFWSTQAVFIGIEGVPSDLGQIERFLFGLNYNRLKWSAPGSTYLHNPPLDDKCKMLLSHEDESCSNEEPVTDGGRFFTLIDTYTLTATKFRAKYPPSALIVCGQEGGMQRAVLCSYDWKRATFAREAVVRIKTLALNRMSRVDRFRFALSRRTADECQTQELSDK
ncbi:hypothetical protein F4806DRAFT_503341 [Annulohypoxylon nitens]|nr:hypothetical protein F4806DRAFT_503341 [Annulohypoxylon nitens]